MPLTASQLARPFGGVQEYVDWAYPGFSSLEFWSTACSPSAAAMFLPAIVVGWPVLTFSA